MRQQLIKIFNWLAVLLALPFAATCWLAKLLGRGGTEVFRLWGQFFAVAPGLPGSYLRRAFYRLTLDYCSASCHIGFGALFAHRESRVGSGVYIGNYAMLGKVNLGDDCLIGSRTSILSGQQQHRFSEDGRWLPANLNDFVTVNIGQNAWIGEAAVIMADVGKGAAVSAGSVVANPLPEYVVVAGNPARFVRKMELESADDPEAES
jgi:acetyltransferase-like isoleucine patch superfamily enzyme